MQLDPRRYISTLWQTGDWKRAAQDLSECLTRLATDANQAFRNFKVNDLVDVDLATMPADGQVLKYNALAQLWRPATVTAGGGVQSAFLAYKAADISASSTGSFSSPYDTTVYDELSEWDGANYFTPKASGLYLFSAGLSTKTPFAGGSYRILTVAIWENQLAAGAQVVGELSHNFDGDGSNRAMVTGTVPIYCTAGKTYSTNFTVGSVSGWDFKGGRPYNYFGAVRVR